MKLGAIYRQLLSALAAGGIDHDEARSMARLLLAHDRNCSPAALILHFDEEDDISRFQPALARLIDGEPLQYLLGEAEFMGLMLAVSSDVLIPRGDSEPVAEAAIALLKKLPAPRVADICTGSGAYALALAAHVPAAEVWATELSAAALKLAEINAATLGLNHRISFLLGDLCLPLRETGLSFNMIVANPPYIESGEMAALPHNVRREPSLALDGGTDGMDFYRRLCLEAPPLLSPGGYLLLEHGAEQGAAVRALLEAAGLNWIHAVRDYGGRERAALAKAD